MQTQKGNKEFFLQTCKLYGVSQLKKHCTKPEVGWMGGRD